jgi:anaerobic ribonucleoside-triphosphate reductase activating protein
MDDGFVAPAAACYPGPMSGSGEVEVELHAIEPRSRANGPGVRFALWFQGCDLGCPGCFNPETHAGPGRQRLPVAALVEQIAAAPGLDGVTISGGEPFQQPAALLALVRGVRARRDLSILVFSGYRRAELEAMPLGPAVLAELDVLVDGRYVAPLHLGANLRGSANQTAHFLTDRHRPEDLAAAPVAEVTIGPDGQLRLSGVAPLRPPR